MKFPPHRSLHLRSFSYQHTHKHKKRKSVHSLLAVAVGSDVVLWNITKGEQESVLVSLSRTDTQTYRQTYIHTDRHTYTHIHIDV